MNFFKKFSKNLSSKNNEEYLSDGNEYLENDDYLENDYYLDDDVYLDEDDYLDEEEKLEKRREKLEIEGMKTNLSVFQWLEEKFNSEIPESCIEAYEDESINALPKSIQKGYIKDLNFPIPLPLEGSQLFEIVSKYSEMATEETEAIQERLDDGLEDPETVDVSLPALYISVAKSILRSTEFYPDFDFLSKEIIEELKKEESQKSWTESMAKHGFFGNWDEVYNLLSPTGLMNAYTWMRDIELSASHNDGSGEGEYLFGDLFKANTPNWEVYIPVTIFSKYNSNDEIGRILSDYALVDKIKKFAGISFSYNHLGLTEKDITEIEDSEEKGCVYFIRNKDIYKIGITENALRRFGQLKPDEVINVVTCSNYKSLEKELHNKFKDYRIPQTEYFRLSSKEVKEVNNAMTKLANF